MASLQSTDPPFCAPRSFRERGSGFAGDKRANETTLTKLLSDALRRRLAAVLTRLRRGATAAGTAVAASTVSTGGCVPGGDRCRGGAG